LVAEGVLVAVNVWVIVGVNEGVRVKVAVGGNEVAVKVAVGGTGVSVKVAVGGTGVTVAVGVEVLVATPKLTSVTFV
jgi:hypothetical protein